MQRRGFLAAILAAGAAPTFVKSESLMPLWVPKRDVITHIYVSHRGDQSVFDRFVQLQLRKIADGLGISFEQLASEPAALKYSSARIVFRPGSSMGKTEHLTQSLILPGADWSSARKPFVDRNSN